MTEAIRRKGPTAKQRIARARSRVEGILEDVEVLVEYGVEERMATHTRMLVNAEEVNSRQPKSTVSRTSTSGSRVSGTIGAPTSAFASTKRSSGCRVL